jgi:hypothetical protein
MSPAQARAFLQAARELDIARSPMPDASPIALAYFRTVAAVESDAPQTDEPQAVDAFDDTPAPAGSAIEQAGEGQTDHLVELLDTLRDAGVVPQTPRALLGKPAGGAERLERIRGAMRAARERDELAYLRRGEELAYLANTLISGCSIQGRPMTAQEASDAAVAVCNLGLEYWPSHWTVGTPGGVAGAGSADGGKVPEDVLVSCDLIRVFQAGWSILYSQVCVQAAERLLEVLGMLRPGDSELQEGIQTLRGELSQGLREGRPWRARDAIDVIAGLDMLTWYGLLGLIDEYPVLHAAVRATQGRKLLRVSPTDFEFIASNEQIACAADFMRSLPTMLGAT